MQGQKQGIIISLVLAIPIINFTMLSFPLGQDQYAYSQPSETNPTVKAAVMGVDLTNIHPSPSHLKAGSKFEIYATVVNNSKYDNVCCWGRVIRLYLHSLRVLM